MRSRQLQTVLTDYVEAAAGHLRAEVQAGAEVPFEVGSRVGRAGTRGTPLYCYRALTGEFIDEREAALKRLPCHAEAAKLLEGFDGLERYLANAGADVAHATRRARARAAMRLLLEDVFQEQTDFQARPDRVRAAIERLEHSAFASPSQLTLVATLHGLAICSPELQLAKGLVIAHPEAIEGVPQGALAASAEAGADSHLLVVHTTEQDDAREGVPRGRQLLRDLLRALRLFGDGRVALGALGWFRIAAGTWAPVAIGGGGRRHGTLVVTIEQEDELRAFRNLVARRAPKGDEVAWALRRFELGCERDAAHEALTDHVVALRALLEPEGPASGLLAGRVAALCAAPEGRAQLSERVAEALAVERSLIAGTSVKPATVRALVDELSAHLRALLSDVICGHLDPDLVTLADELLLAPADGEDVAEADCAGGDAKPELEGKAQGDPQAEADDEAEADVDDEAEVDGEDEAEVDGEADVDDEAEVDGVAEVGPPRSAGPVYAGSSTGAEAEPGDGATSRAAADEADEGDEADDPVGAGSVKRSRRQAVKRR